jgi:hypothetical protein
MSTPQWLGRSYTDSSSLYSETPMSEAETPILEKSSPQMSQDQPDPAVEAVREFWHPSLMWMLTYQTHRMVFSSSTKNTVSLDGSIIMPALRGGNAGYWFNRDERQIGYHRGYCMFCFHWDAAVSRWSVCPSTCGFLASCSQFKCTLPDGLGIFLVFGKLLKVGNHDLSPTSISYQCYTYSIL